jgi:hypothetical protein
MFVFWYLVLSLLSLLFVVAVANVTLLLLENMSFFCDCQYCENTDRRIASGGGGGGGGGGNDDDGKEK